LGQGFIADCNMFPIVTMCTQLRTLRTASHEHAYVETYAFVLLENRLDPPMRQWSNYDL